MSRELGVQFARQGIRVNALCPGPVNTPLLQELFAKDPERAARRLVHIPIGRFAEPEELAAAVAFLASDDASFITAADLPRRRRHLRRLRHTAIGSTVIAGGRRPMPRRGRTERRNGRMRRPPGGGRAPFPPAVSPGAPPAPGCEVLAGATSGTTHREERP